MCKCAGLIIYKSNFILLNILYQNEHLECMWPNQCVHGDFHSTALAGVIPTSSLHIFAGLIRHLLLLWQCSILHFLPCAVWQELEAGHVFPSFEFPWSCLHFEVSFLISKHKNADRAWKATSISTDNQWHVVGQRVVCWQQLERRPVYSSTQAHNAMLNDSKIKYWHLILQLCAFPYQPGDGFGNARERCKHLWTTQVWLIHPHVHIPRHLAMICSTLSLHMGQHMICSSTSSPPGILQKSKIMVASWSCDYPLWQLDVSCHMSQLKRMS